MDVKKILISHVLEAVAREDLDAIKNFSVSIRLPDGTKMIIKVAVVDGSRVNLKLVKRPA